MSGVVESDTEPCEISSPVVAKNGFRPGLIDSYLFQKLSQQTSCLGPNRTTSLLSAFPAQEDARGRAERQIVGFEINDLADTGAGVEEETQQRIVPTSVSG